MRGSMKRLHFLLADPKHTQHRQPSSVGKRAAFMNPSKGKGYALHCGLIHTTGSDHYLVFKGPTNEDCFNRKENITIN